MVYYIIGGSTAEIRFAWDDCSFAFRGAAGSVDPGTEENWSAETTELRLEYEGGDLVLTCQQAESGARLAPGAPGILPTACTPRGHWKMRTGRKSAPRPQTPPRWSENGERAASERQTKNILIYS